MPRWELRRCGNRRPHHGRHQDHHGRHQDHPDRLARCHRRCDRADSIPPPGRAAAAASCRGSGVARRFRTDRCGRRVLGCPHPDGGACCPVRPGSWAGRSAGPPNVAAQNCRHRRDCCPPAGTAALAWATSDGPLRTRIRRRVARQDVARNAARRMVAGEPLGARLRGAGEPDFPARQAGHRPRGARRSVDARQPAGARQEPDAGESPAAKHPERGPSERHRQRDCSAPIPAGGSEREWASARPHREPGGSHRIRQYVPGRPRRRWHEAPCLPRWEMSREACERPVPPPSKRQTSHTRRDRRAS